jgi:CubicO group peptidase (beta-lactamase class C family)
VADGYDRTGQLRRVFARIERFVSDGVTDAAALAVAVNGEPVAEWYAGDARPELAAGSDVLWPLASISKLYTAATIMATAAINSARRPNPVRILDSRSDCIDINPCSPT